MRSSGGLARRQAEREIGRRQFRLPNPVKTNLAIKFLAEIIKRARPTTPYLITMQRKTANIDVRVEPVLVEKIDAWRARQRVPPSRSAAIVHMLEHFLEHDAHAPDPTWKTLLSKA
jgi:hypothetical protein